MKPQLACDAIALEYGGNAVFLRPSLRAALHLERLHGGFPELLRKIEEFDTLTVWQVITATAGKEAADKLFSYAATQPLSGFYHVAQKPLHDLVWAFIPKSPEDESAATAEADRTPWSEVFKELYGFATGWLGWTPETAWNATPQEITDAFNAHIAKLKAIHGEAEETNPGQSEEQRKQNAELGLDPEFDRAGLAALKELSAMREGMAA
ncbi:hypothetical protein [Shimia sediminis]|uniref:hypothetical protein n=1 Tax=Shimia sediminis TaxID=2497945 RepID=UPI000F8E0CD6|nr:hypothetical protein [Shimia sediminis]